MVMIEEIIFYLVLLDSLVAGTIAWCMPKTAKKFKKGFWKHFPITRGWSALYIILVLWIGYALYRLGVLSF